MVALPVWDCVADLEDAYEEDGDMRRSP